MYDDYLSRLLEQRARETGNLQTFFKEAETRAKDKESPVLLAEDQQEFERRSADLDKFDELIKQIKDRAQGDATADEYRADAEKFLRPTGLQGQDDEWADQEKRAMEFFTASADDIRNHRGPDSIEISLRGIGTERDKEGRTHVVETRSLKPLLNSEGVEVRALSDGTTTAGGYTFGPSFRKVLYENLIFHSAMRQTRATVLTTGGGENLLLPKVTSAPGAGTVVSEGAVIGETDPVFGQGTLSAYKYANLVLVSSELEQDTQVDLLGYLAKIMGQRLGDGMGADYVTGTGTTKATGILVSAGTTYQVVGGTPGTAGPTFTELTKVFDRITPPYQINAEWFFGQTMMQQIRALTNSQGTPIFLPSLSGSSPDMLFGKPIILDPNMPTPASNATSIAFGDFSAYFIRDASGLRFERSIDRYFDTDQIAYRAVGRTDGLLLDTTGAIATYKGGTA